ncbi:MAG: pyridoxal-phosphate dependent enzyme [Bacteroidota bacterium]
MIDAQSISNAAKRISPYIHRTPVITSLLLDKITGASLYFKCENFQKAGAFKARGAHNAVFSLEATQANKGVITHSSGNHAGALSLAAKNRGIPAYVVMPSNAPKVKIAAVRAYGGQITFCEPTLKAREQTLGKIQAQNNATEIHPYNNENIIAGQATTAQEIFEELSPDIVIAPVGGGGLLSGTALSAHFFMPNTKVMAAEPRGADDAWQSFHAGEIIPSVNPKTIADGLLTSLGSLTYPIIRNYVEDIITVEESSIIKAMHLVWERMKIIIEPSSAVPLAAVLENKDRFRGMKIAIIISGGNVDLNKLPWQ